MTLLDNRKLKFICVCAYLHNEILILERAERENTGIKVLDDKDEFLKNTIMSIKSIIEENRFTYEDIKILYKFFPQVKRFYDLIGKTISNHIKIGAEWLPGLVILSVLQEFTLRGYKHFEYIPFTDAIDKFIVEKKINSSRYLKIAGDIYESVVSYEYKRPKKNKRKKR
ncbi:hypothetical protein [Halarcobacter anaerophilus]|uniref:Uncharacterized protein n=1 Tax=Halarcobacter anaerophilus TaxID=877500 RepID=A0A4Q0Y0M8_9BACT|nr:hypothetical protein [Halarcobacter anaerophilus]QDF28955.1 hypothetical protein AANAER_1475 [Halarcobacter anaerophilus]RXJ63590.1 hypothetical protein CRV06_05200 [Halarcobacter anaerophilus]